MDNARARVREGRSMLFAREGRRQTDQQRCSAWCPPARHHPDAKKKPAPPGSARDGLCSGWSPYAVKAVWKPRLRRYGKERREAVRRGVERE